MALTNEVEKKLQKTGLIDLFKKNKAAYEKLAKDAHDNIKQAINSGLSDNNANVQTRIDDVVQILEPALRVDEKLIKHLNEKKLREQYWFRYFADLILDQTWTTITK